jgi:hypothetical protein
VFAIAIALLSNVYRAQRRTAYAERLYQRAAIHDKVPGADYPPAACPASG